ncbi:hypothetical protein IZ6_26660 [Terrihabitans soli]|uniref:Nucleotide-diphospho-sugar transferase domain-containing protein n=1 Tax=Terrihabitans soli TaxID=708113 RepID=A0A6S6QY27_9HYPH|nr:putative nucleotide-diphospho-sugar transferase [Terrihabitans soli]BCJ91931.1 hypothetical protein IZ6_26660 [Terrihabitans soli]
MSRFLVLSSHTRPKTTAAVNHAIYCEKHGYDYLFDVTPYPLVSIVDQKIHTALNALKRGNCEWLFWIDDDAYFANIDIKLEQFIPDDPKVEFIFCRSPVNQKGLWTLINAGIYFVKNTPSAIALLEDVLSVDKNLVRDEWNFEKYGHYVHAGSDQARFTYLFATRGMIGTTVHILDHTAFNARVYNFTKAHNEHFICHLAASQNKYVQLQEMRNRFDLDKYMLPVDSGLYDPHLFRASLFSDDPQPPPAKKPIGLLLKFLTRVKVKLLRPLLGAS